MIRRAFLLLSTALLSLVSGASELVTAADFANRVAPLIDPGKLKTLGERGANPRVCKVAFWLESARNAGFEPDAIARKAVAAVGMTGDSATMTADAMMRNRQIAERLGCLDADGMDELRQGKSPTVRRGPYKGDELSVDHIIPRAVCPELDNVIANLEFMPMRMNAGKQASVGARQRDLARRLQRAGLLSATGFAAVEARAATPSRRNR